MSNLPRPTEAMEIMQKRCEEVNEIATGYNMVMDYIQRLESENGQLQGDLDTGRKDYRLLQNKYQGLLEEYEKLHEYGRELEASEAKAQKELARLEKVKEFLNDVSDMITDQLSGKTEPTIIGAKPPTANQDNDDPANKL